MGFQRVRKDEADTTPILGTDGSENIYRHPSRQGTGYAEDKFSMLHDINSLGVCLLEIAMWRSFVEWNSNGLKINNTKGCNLMGTGRCRHGQEFDGSRGYPEETDQGRKEAGPDRPRREVQPSCRALPRVR
jgi:hypothetical protein